MKEEKLRNPMRKIKIEKVTIHATYGSRIELADKMRTLLERITGMKPVQTLGKKRIKQWDVRPGKPIGWKVTLRGKKAKEILKLMFQAIDNKVRESWFDKYGNFSFGIAEYIDVPGMKYDPELGILGFDVCVTFERPGYRISRRRRCKARVPERHRTTKEEVIEYLKKEFGVEVIP